MARTLREFIIDVLTDSEDYRARVRAEITRLEAEGWTIVEGDESGGYVIWRTGEVLIEGDHRSADEFDAAVEAVIAARGIRLCEIDCVLANDPHITREFAPPSGLSGETAEELMVDVWNLSSAADAPSSHRDLLKLLDPEAVRALDSREDIAEYTGWPVERVEAALSDDYCHSPQVKAQ